MAQQLARACAQVGLPLCPRLREMLDEHPSHCTDRRGCGLTQATRRLSEHINRPRDPLDPADLGLFEGWSLRCAGDVAARSIALGWPYGWRRLAEAPAALRTKLSGMPGANGLLAVQTRLEAVDTAVSDEESRLLLAMLGQIVAGHESDLPCLPPMMEKPKTGSCSQAEEFFLEIAHGKVRRGGRVNVLVDDARRPVLIEKIGLGESHSAILLRTVAIQGVAVPPGALFALAHRGCSAPLATHRHGVVLPLAKLEAARFLRLTTLAVSPANRARAFGAQFRRQVQGGMVSPQSTTLADLGAWAAERLREH